jgi:hypothetical protein
LEQALHKLDGKHFLSTIVVRFYYYRSQSVGVIISELAYFLVLIFDLVPSFFEWISHDVRWTDAKYFEIINVDLLPFVKVVIIAAMA